MTSLAAVQTWDAGRYAENARFVSDLGAEILSWLSPRAGERILDLGCGDGALTEKIAAAGASVIGVDTSAPMLEAARRRGLDARLADARALPFETEFDAVFSNAVLHWVAPPEAAARSIARALKPGGRFVAEFGGHGNIAAIATALRAVAARHGGDPALVAPWYYPTPEEYRAVLAGAGFEIGRIGLFARPTPLPTGMAGWLETFRKPFFDQFEDARRQMAFAETIDLLGPALRDSAGRWSADYVRLRVEARLAGSQ